MEFFLKHRAKICASEEGYPLEMKYRSIVGDPDFYWREAWKAH